MQLMLVCRCLRKISDWTLAGFYSEAYVTGQENVPRDGPIIVAATHHNEIIDIAVLTATIPYRRWICFWAKSSLFKNPFAGALLRACRCIPVYRHPTATGNHGGSKTTPQTELFQQTCVALAKGEVVGVFPEGTSYTEPAIVQVKEGAAWAAIEYVKAITTHSGAEEKEARKDLLIVPAAIVYTDKSRYQSRVVVRYGKAIRVRDLLAELPMDNEEGVRTAAKEITAVIRQRLKEMTINAADWDTCNSAKMAIEASWGKYLGLHKYIEVSQILIDFLSGESEDIRPMKQSLVKYLGLLHYTGISHTALDYLYPLTGSVASGSSTNIPTISIAVMTTFYQLCKMFLHPCTIAFLPLFVIHLPAYIIGWLAGQILPPLDEEEAVAQYKVILGGVGVGLSYGIVTWMIFVALRLWGEDMTTWLLEVLPPFFIAAIGIPRQRLLENVGGVAGMVQYLIRTVGITVGAVWILWKWHNYLVRGNLERWRYLSASVKILVGLIFAESHDLSEERLVAYSRPPPPAESRFVQRRTPEQSTKIAKPLPVSATRLIRPLFQARMDAVGVVRRLGTMRKVDGQWEKDERRDLPKKGG